MKKRDNIVKELYCQQKGLCYLCNLYLKKSEATIDHIHPKSKGGKRVKGNLALAHAFCNHVKSDKEPQPPEFYHSKFREGKYNFRHEKIKASRKARKPLIVLNTWSSICKFKNGFCLYCCVREKSLAAHACNPQKNEYIR